MVSDQYVVEEGRARMADRSHIQHLLVHHQRSLLVSPSPHCLAYIQFCRSILRPSTTSQSMAATIYDRGLHLCRSWGCRLVLSACQSDQSMVARESISKVLGIT